MVDEVKYIIWGLIMMIHGGYMFMAKEIFFGWDTIRLETNMQYLLIGTYVLFSLWIVLYAIYNIVKNKEKA